MPRRKLPITAGKAHTLFVPGKPEPKKRPRLGQYGNFYSPDANNPRGWESLVRAHWFKASGGQWEIMRGPVKVQVVFKLGKEPGMSITISEVPPGEWWLKGPDIDNCLKAALDALNGCAWVDDRQVVSLEAQKIKGS